MRKSKYIETDLKNNTLTRVIIMDLRVAFLVHVQDHLL